MVTRIDRLARSIGDLPDIVRAIKVKGAALKATEQPIDTGTAAGKAFLDMLGVFAEFETNLRKERQLEGIAKAKEASVYKGRQAAASPSRLIYLLAHPCRIPQRVDEFCTIDIASNRGVNLRPDRLLDLIDLVAGDYVEGDDDLQAHYQRAEPFGRSRRRSKRVVSR
jgi:hypothetical protein